MKYIDVENLKSLIKERYNTYKIGQHSPFRNGKVEALREIIELIDYLKQEQTEVDLEKEINEQALFYNYALVGTEEITAVAKHFFELGLSVNNPITAADRGTAEEIIVNLKRVEQDYHIDLTREMEWLRNQVKKGK